MQKGFEKMTTRWARHRDWFKRHMAEWEAFVPETDEEMKDRQVRIDECHRLLDLTMRCEHGRARELWEAIADVQETRDIALWDRQKLAQLVAERNQVIGIK